MNYVSNLVRPRRPRGFPSILIVAKLPRGNDQIPQERRRKKRGFFTRTRTEEPVWIDGSWFIFLLNKDARDVWLERGSLEESSGGCLGPSALWAPKTSATGSEVDHRQPGDSLSLDSEKFDPKTWVCDAGRLLYRHFIFASLKRITSNSCALFFVVKCLEWFASWGTSLLGASSGIFGTALMVAGCKKDGRDETWIKS